MQMLRCTRLASSPKAYRHRQSTSHTRPRQEKSKRLSRRLPRGRMHGNGTGSSFAIASVHRCNKLSSTIARCPNHSFLARRMAYSCIACNNAHDRCFHCPSRMPYAQQRPWYHQHSIFVLCFCTSSTGQEQLRIVSVATPGVGWGGETTPGFARRNAGAPPRPSPSSTPPRQRAIDHMLALYRRSLGEYRKYEVYPLIVAAGTNYSPKNRERD
jgi:hypothetical protein